MEQITEVIKKHPLAIGAGAVVLLLLMMRSGSSSNSGAMALESQKTAASTDVAIANINAQSSAARTAAMADIWKSAIGANTDVAVANQGNMVQIVLGAMGYKATMQQLSDTHDVANRQITASQAVAGDQLKAVMDMHTQDVNAALTALGKKIDFQHYAVDTSYAHLPEIIDYQKSKDATSASTAVQLATVNGQTTQAVTALNTSAARTTANASANQGIFGDIMDVVGMFL